MRKLEPPACCIQRFLRISDAKHRLPDIYLALCSETLNQWLELRKNRYRVSDIRLFPIERNPVSRGVDVFSKHICAFGRSHSCPAHKLNEVRRILCIGVELLLSDVLDGCKKLLPSWGRSNRFVHFHLFEVGSRGVANHCVVECDCNQVPNKPGILV